MEGLGQTEGVGCSLRTSVALDSRWWLALFLQWVAYGECYIESIVAGAVIPVRSKNARHPKAVQSETLLLEDCGQSTVLIKGVAARRLLSSGNKQLQPTLIRCSEYEG